MGIKFTRYQQDYKQAGEELLKSAAIQQEIKKAFESNPKNRSIMKSVRKGFYKVVVKSGSGYSRAAAFVVRTSKYNKLKSEQNKKDHQKNITAKSGKKYSKAQLRRISKYYKNKR